MVSRGSFHVLTAFVRRFFFVLGDAKRGLSEIDNETNSLPSIDLNIRVSSLWLSYLRYKVMSTI